MVSEIGNSVYVNTNRCCCVEVGGRSKIVLSHQELLLAGFAFFDLRKLY